MQSYCNIAKALFGTSQIIIWIIQHQENLKLLTADSKIVDVFWNFHAG